jgi:chemotaxis protein CheD
MIQVGISDYKTSQFPDILVTYALGSCIGIALRDPATKIGGLAHIMLPSSSMRGDGRVDNRMKYADTAIEDMLNELAARGAKRRNVRAKIAGGANMFNCAENTLVDTIGERNIEAVRRALDRLGIPIVGEDVGSNYGRTVYFSLGDGKLEVRAVGKAAHEF